MPTDKSVSELTPTGLLGSIGMTGGDVGAWPSPGLVGELVALFCVFVFEL